METPLQSNTPAKKGKQRTSFYQAVWRWHFYAGIIFAPFFITLAVSGSIYLFKPQIESFLYQDAYYVERIEESTLPVGTQLSEVKEQYPHANVTSVTFHDDPSRTTEIRIIEGGELHSVYVNPYNGDVVGSLSEDKKLMNIVKKLHSELIVGGTFANRLIELAACWAVILIGTGLYIWWPRNSKKIWGTVLPRLRRRGRPLWRDLHAVPAFWLSVFILILIATGLPWSGVFGEGVSRIANATNTGYPPYAHSFGPAPESITRTKEVADDVPWAAENMPVPESSTSDYVPLEINDVHYLAQAADVAKPFTISMPRGETGVYTVSTSHSKPGDEATLHFDQYSGAMLSDVRFEHYGVMGKAITIGIALHEGRLFGLANQLIGFVVCLGFIGIVISSFLMWRKRKPQGKLGAPASPKDSKTMRTVTIIIVVMGVIMPLVGLSLIVVYLLDKFVLTKVKPLKAWLAS